MEKKPSLICFTTVFSEFQFISQVAKYIKERYKNIFQIVGGPHISLCPEDAIKEDFDAICIGEGELPVLELCNQIKEGIEPNSIKNLWIKKNGIIAKNPCREFIKDLDTLPYPDRDMWEPWIESTENIETILLGRGCVYDCTYCSNEGLSKVAEGRYQRNRSPEKIIEEIKKLLNANNSLKYIYFENESFNSNLKYSEQFCKSLERFNSSINRELHYWTNIRPTSNINKGFIEYLYNAGFGWINIGVESGSESIRKKILNRKESNSNILEIVKYAKEFGIKISVFCLIGLPTETYKDFKKTIKFLKIIKPNFINRYIFFPYKGTRLYDICVEKGLITPELNYDYERIVPRLKLAGFSKKRIRHEYDSLYFKVYLPKFLFPLLLIMNKSFKKKIELTIKKILCKTH